MRTASRWAAALALAAAAPLAFAAPPPVVSPELEPDAPVTTTERQDLARIASDGTGYLVAWVTSRQAAQAIRVDATGAPLDPRPLELGRHANGSMQLAFNGTHHLAVTCDYQWSSTAGRYVARVLGRRIARDGSFVDAAPVALTPDVAIDLVPLGLASDGTGWLLTYGAPAGGVSGMLLGADLALLTPGGFTVATTPGNGIGGSVAFDGTRYQVAVAAPETSSPSGRDVSLVPVDRFGNPGAAVAVTAIAGVQEDTPAVGCAQDGTCLVAWRTAFGGGAAGARVSAGAVVDATPLALAPGTNAPAVAHDGTQFVVVNDLDLVGEPGKIFATRVPTSGAAGALSPVVVSPAGGPYRWYPAVAAGPADDLVVWSAGVLTGVRLSRAGAILAPERAISPPRNSETRPVAARLGAGFLLAWNDDRDQGSGDVYGARLSLSGAPLQPAAFRIGANPSTGPLQSLAAASDGTRALVVWGSSDTMRAARLAADGTLLDPSGVTVASGRTSATGAQVALGAADHLAVWAESGTDVVGLRITPAATPRELPFRVGSGDAGAVASDGQAWVVAVRSGGAVRAVGVSADAAVSAPVTIRASGAVLYSPVSIAGGAGRYLVVYEVGAAGAEDVEAAFVTSTAGALVAGTPFAISTASGAQKRPTATFDGTRFLVAWEDARGGNKDVYGTAVEVDGTVVSPSGDALSALAEDEETPQLAAQGGARALLAYARLDLSAGHGTIRARARFLTSAAIALGTACAAAAECATGFCVDGVCCASACGGGAAGDCQACSVAAGAAVDGVCGPVAAGAVCRPSAGPCDVAEACDGASLACPADAFATAATVCRPAAGVCDVAETCSGTSAACPADVLQPGGAVCRPVAGPCDEVDVCNGTSAACPSDFVKPWGTLCAAAQACASASYCDGTYKSCPTAALAPASVVCRGPADLCEGPARCTGWSGGCPANPPLAAGTTCRAAAGACDVAEACDGTSHACPADAFMGSTTVCRASAGACDPAERCDGASAACPADARSPAGTVCRLAAGACDVEERCDGTSAACPIDAFEPPTTVCRAAAGACDVAERCTGLDPACPVDALADAGTICRPAAGDCDVGESCTGFSVDCPGDALRAAGAVCRPAAGPCDVAEACTGASAACPADAVAAAGTVCRPASGACDAAETCDGTAVACAVDAPAPDGTACAGGTCRAGACDATAPAPPPAPGGGGGGGCGTTGRGGGAPALLAVLAGAVLLRRRGRLEAAGARGRP